MGCERAADGLEAHRYPSERQTSMPSSAQSIKVYHVHVDTNTASVADDQVLLNIANNHAFDTAMDAPVLSYVVLSCLVLSCGGRN